MAETIGFTKLKIEALPAPPAGTRAVYHDSKGAGLQLRITDKGIKTFSVFRRIKGGAPERVTLGRFPDVSVENARRRAEELTGIMAKGDSPAKDLRIKRQEMTLSDLFDEYMTRRAALNKWPEKARTHYRLYLAHWGNRKISSLTPSEVDKWHKGLPAEMNKRRERIKAEIAAAGAGKSDYTPPKGFKTTPISGEVSANHALKLLHAMFAMAQEERIWQGDNPAHGRKKFKERSRERFIQADELPRFFKALADEANETMRHYFLLSLLTGARRANVLAMRWQDVNLDRAEWRIPDTKNDTPQTITLTAEAIDVLKKQKAVNEANAKAEGDAATRGVYVFESHGKSGHLEEPKKGWERILSRAGLADLRIHDLRRTMGSWQAKTGASLAIIGKSLNHKTHNATQIYARLDLDPVRESVERATAAMRTAGGMSEGAEIVNLKRRKSA